LLLPEKGKESGELSLYLFDIRTGEKSGGAHPFGWLRESLVAIAGAAQKAWRIPIKDRRTVFFLCEIPHESG
jgi:hypothetical protein